MLKFLKNSARINKRTFAYTFTVFRFLRGLPNKKHEFKYLPDYPKAKPMDEVEMAKTELYELTGGLDLQELREILQPNKSREQNNMLETQLECAKNKYETQLESSKNKNEIVKLQPTYNLAAYVKDSPTLQNLVNLGVNLSQIERRKGLPEFILKLHFEKDIKPYLLFLKDQGISENNFGEMITKNPLIFKEDLNDLQTRVNYLEAKSFKSNQIQRILVLNPFWLMFSTRRIDRRLGYFQKEFQLTGYDVRFLASKSPRLITYNMDHIRENTFCVREEMGFDKDEIKCLLLSKPRLWMLKSDDLIERFAYVHNDMKISHDMLLQTPEILTSREFRIRERHEFLKLLGRAQYNPERDLYISPKKLVEGDNNYFARHVAKSDIETFSLFLKTR